jgi:hypothetical protein
MKIMFSTIPPVLFVKDGRLRGLGTSGLTRDPRCPTCRPSTRASFQHAALFGLTAPKGTPTPRDGVAALKQTAMPT